MKKTLLASLIVASLTMACVVVPTDRHGGHPGAVIAPILPPLVILETEPYYFYSGYHYHFLNDQWYYAQSRRGPWVLLPQDHYPREVRFKYRDRGRDGRGYDDRHRYHRHWDDRD